MFACDAAVCQVEDLEGHSQLAFDNDKMLAYTILLALASCATALPADLHERQESSIPPIPLPSPTFVETSIPPVSLPSPISVSTQGPAQLTSSAATAAIDSAIPISELPSPSSVAGPEAPSSEEYYPVGLQSAQ